MFKPVSETEYSLLVPVQQRLVCSLDDPPNALHLREKWGERACAIFSFKASDSLYDLVRDLLANPQVRTIVFDGEGAGRQVIGDFWHSTDHPDWDIPSDHVSLVRQFVDLYDGDCGGGVMQPFWPKRLTYPLPPA